MSASTTCSSTAIFADAMYAGGVGFIPVSGLAAGVAPAAYPGDRRFAPEVV